MWFRGPAPRWDSPVHREPIFFLPKPECQSSFTPDWKAEIGYE